MNRPKTITRLQTPGTTGERWKEGERVWWPLGRGVGYRISVQAVNWGLPLSPSLYKCTFLFDMQTEKCEKH